MADKTDKFYTSTPTDVQVVFNASSTAEEASESERDGVLYATPHGLYLNKTLISPNAFAKIALNGVSRGNISITETLEADAKDDTISITFGDSFSLSTNTSDDSFVVDSKGTIKPILVETPSTTAKKVGNPIEGDEGSGLHKGGTYLVWLYNSNTVINPTLNICDTGDVKIFLMEGLPNGTVTQLNTTDNANKLTDGVYFVTYDVNYVDGIDTKDSNGNGIATSKFLFFKNVALQVEAQSADKLTSGTVGSTTQPIYFKDGKPTATSYSVSKSVPANAVFTDTKYSGGVGISITDTTITNSGVRAVATGSSNGTISVNTNGTTANVSVKGLGSAAYKNVVTSVSNTTDIANDLVTSGGIANALTNYVKSSTIGKENGVASLNENGQVPSSQLPSYVDDVIEGYYLDYSGSKQFFKENSATTTNLIAPESGKIYVNLSTNKTYRYSGSTYIEISSTEIPIATSSILGGIKIGYTASGKNYPVKLDGNNKAYVNVPWTDTNTDTKVTAVGNHYTPSADADQQLSVDASATSTTNITGSSSAKNVVTGVNLQRDAKGHVTGVTVDSLKIYSTDNNTIPAAYCTTDGSNGLKTASYTGYVLRKYNVFPIIFTKSNTAQGNLTLSINGTTAQGIVLNGESSSATNYTLPAGTYFCYYDGAVYHINTDDKLPKVRANIYWE